MDVGAEIWQFSTDYPGLGGADDSKLPIGHVAIKAWDQDWWMSTFDKHAAAISGSAQIAKLVNIYRAQGIGLHLWCVPKGRNVSRMLALSKACLDVPGVLSLTFDVEPYTGFCAADCAYLATTLMRQLRAARPNAVLGVTYDPRPQHWSSSGTAEWLKYADIASPMVYWVSFAGQGVWAAPESAVSQAHTDLRQRLASGRAIRYAPLLQGSASASQVVAAVKKTVALGGKPSLWRRGVVAAATWTAVNAIAEPAPPPPPPPDCSEIEAQLIQVRQDLATAQRNLASTRTQLSTCTQTVARQGVTINALQQSKADLETALLAEREKVRQLQDQLDHDTENYNAIRNAIGVLYDVIQSVRPGG